MAEDREKYLFAGCNDFIAKPIDRKLFCETLSRHLPRTDSPTVSDDVQSPIHPEGDIEDAAHLAVISRFIDDLEARIQRVRNHTDQEDWTKLRGEAHDLKGMGGGFGYPQLSGLAGELEFAIAKGDRNDIEHRVRRLEQLVQRISAGRPGTAESQ